MAAHKHASEAPRTAPATRGRRAPPEDARIAAFAAHYGTTLRFTDELRALRCRETDNFGGGINETMDAFRPLFAPWNMEILFSLYMHGPQRFNALKRALGSVSSRVLTDKLRALAEQDHVAHDDVRYALTRHGERVARLLHPLVFYVHNHERV